jgi:hypothetical protein
MVNWESEVVAPAEAESLSEYKINKLKENPVLNNNTVKEYVENSNLVQKKEWEKYEGLYLLKYKRKVFYDALWDSFLEEMRGTVVAEDYTPIVMPFKKIYNYNENGTTIDDSEEVTAVRKVNGFMLALTYVPEVDRVLPSTTGSLDSEFISKGLEYVSEDLAMNLRNFFFNSGVLMTWLFEVVHPDDPHIIPEEQGLYLLEGREVLWDGEETKDQKFLDEMAEGLGVKRPEWFTGKFGDIVKSLPEQKHEGFVIHGEDTTLKLKTPYYLAAKFLGRMKDEKFETWLDQDVLKEKMDEEFYPLLDKLKEDKEKFLTLDEQGRISYVREFLNG